MRYSPHDAHCSVSLAAFFKSVAQPRSSKGESAKRELSTMIDPEGISAYRIERSGPGRSPRQQLFSISSSSLSRPPNTKPQAIRSVNVIFLDANAYSLPLSGSLCFSLDRVARDRKEACRPHRPARLRAFEVGAGSADLLTTAAARQRYEATAGSHQARHSRAGGGERNRR
jgi:hypothetical protein